jgi:hypothetical protein
MIQPTDLQCDSPYVCTLYADPKVDMLYVYVEVT